MLCDVVDKVKEAATCTYRLGLVSCVVLSIQVGEGREETLRDAVLVVEVDSLLDAGVTNNVAMSKVLSNNSASWLLFLGDLIGIALSVLGVVASIILIGSRSASNLDLCRTELGVVQEKSCLRGSLLLESYSSILGFAS